jgi:hypothetical protein
MDNPSPGRIEEGNPTRIDMEVKKRVLHHGTALHNAPIDWTEPDPAAAQVNIDLLRNMLA